MADPTYTLNFGGAEGGLAGLGLYGSPIDNSTYYTFNGVNNGLSGGTAYDESLCGFKVRFKLPSFPSGNGVIYECGKLCIGLTATTIGVYSRYNNADSPSYIRYIYEPGFSLISGEWLVAYFSKTDFAIVRESTGECWRCSTGNLNVFNSGWANQVGFSYLGISQNYGVAHDFLACDVDYVSIWSSKSNMMIPNLKYKKIFGSNNGGSFGGTAIGSPVDNSNYYTFNGSSGLYFNSGLSFDETGLGVKIKFRPKTYPSGNSCLYKIGKYAVGFTSDNGGKFGVFTRTSTDAKYDASLTMTTSDKVLAGEWFELYVSLSKIALKKIGTGQIWSATGSCYAPVQSGYGESVGCSTAYSIIDGVNGNSAFFDGDIESIDVYGASSDLEIPSDYTPDSWPMIWIF